MRETSLEAFANSREEAMRHRHIILRTMNRVNTPLIAEDIAFKSGLEYNQVSRRMSELERENRVTCTKETKLTSKGRRAFMWKLCQD